MNAQERYGGEPQLHIFTEGDGFEVWLNPDRLRYSGLCIGVGDTRQAAVTDAVKALEWALSTLQETPAPEARS